MNAPLGPDSVSTTFRANLFLALVLITGTLATYRGIGGFEYVNYDDNVYVYENEQVRGGLSREGLAWAFSTNHAGNWHPLTWLSHMLDVEWFGVDSEGSAGAAHRTNLILHTINGVLLFGLLLGGTRRRRPSFLVAAFFLLHPLRVESVAWVAERKDLLCAFFFLAGLIAYGAWARGGGAGRYLLLVACTVCALLSKPMAVSLPFVLLAADIWPLERWTAGKDLPSRILEKLPLFVLAGCAAFVTWKVQASAGALSVEEHFPLFLRFENALATFGVYLRQALWPTGLACFYPLASTVTHEPAAALLIPALLGFAILCAAGLHAWKMRIKRPYVLVGWSWYLVTLLPVIGIVQVGRQAHADRYTYLPLIGPLLILAFGLDAYLRVRPRMRLPIAVVLTLALGSLALLTHRQSRVWENNTSLYRQALEVTERNYLAHANLGVALRAGGDHGGALREFEAALLVGPPDHGVRLNAAVALLRLGRLQRAGKRLEELLLARPDDWRVHSNLGEWAFRSGDLARAEEAYRESFRLDSPYDADRVQLGLVLLSLDELERAGEELRRARASDPLHPGAALGLGLLALREGRPEEARTEFEEALQLAPEHAQANLELGLLLERAGERARARQHLHAAVAHGSLDSRAALRLAWILATAPEPDLRSPVDALALATLVAEKEGYEAGPILEVVAAALARTGDFPAAVRMQEKALGLSLPARLVAAPSAARARLTEYRAGRPWLEER